MLEGSVRERYFPRRPAGRSPTSEVCGTFLWNSLCNGAPSAESKRGDAETRRYVRTAAAVSSEFIFPGMGVLFNTGVEALDASTVNRRPRARPAGRRGRRHRGRNGHAEEEKTVRGTEREALGRCGRAGRGVGLRKVRQNKRHGTDG